MDKTSIGHSVKKIAEALNERNSIFERAISHGRIDHLADDVVTYIEVDRKMVRLMDGLFNHLLKENK